jgi:hypothetical protein
MSVNASPLSRVLAVAKVVVVLLVLSLVPAALHAQVVLGTAASPATAVAGSGVAHVSGSGFPSPTPSAGSVTVSFGTSCLSPTPSATTGALHITSAGAFDLVYFDVPGTLAAGTYSVWVTGTGAHPFTSTTCSTLNVSNSTKKLASCIPSSSLAVSLGTQVVAYAPNGYWDGGTTGIQYVPIEGGGSPASIATPHVVNSCATNSVTGETVCTANNTDVYLITGSTLNTTLTSGSDTTAGFSGGFCNNCGVTINAATNTAVIAGGFTGASGDGLQFLNLATNAFATPFASVHTVSEDVSIDASRNLILSPDEDGYYDLYQVSPSNTLTEYGNFVGAGEFDSAAEDCTTGIALASIEFTDNLYITDLTQAIFTPGTPGTWTAPQQVFTLNTPYGFAAGTCGISVAPGSTHLGVVTGEFGGNSFAALSLPTTSGSGTPALVDYVNAVLPTTPDGFGFSAGFDPHTITAYTSPNTNKAYAVIADFALGSPSYLAIVDLAALLAAPRSAANVVDPTYDLVAHGIVRYVVTH